MEWITAINPATEEVIKKYRPDSATTVQKKLKAGLQAFASWKQIAFEERARILRNAATILRNRKQEWAELMAKEMGKPIAQGRSEAEKCAWACEYYAQEAAQMLKPIEVPTDAARSFVTFEPLGLILAIMPWNFPFWQVFRFLAPHLMAGNTAVLKHASNVPGCALAIQEIMQEAGLPEGVISNLDGALSRSKKSDRPSGYCCGYPHRQHRCRPGRSAPGRSSSEKNSTGTGRQRCIRDPIRCRPRAGCGNLREQSPHQQRPELYCCQAIHRGARRTSRIHRTLCGPHAGKEMGRPRWMSRSISVRLPAPTCATSSTAR